MAGRVSTCLWFDGDAEEAAALYVSLIPNSGIEGTFRHEPSAPPLIVLFTLDGAPYQGLNGGPGYVPTEAVSIVVSTRDQEETDRLWEALAGNGGSESQCGWLKDRFGVSWQIVPEALPRLLTAADRAAADRARQAMLRMRKIDIALLEAAFEGS